MIGLAPEHHAIRLRELLSHLRDRAQAAVDDHGERRELALHLPGPLIVERRHFAILFRSQSLQDRLARVDDDGPAAGILDRGDEVAQERPVVMIVDADPALHGDGNVDRGVHRPHAIRDQPGPCHQAGAERRLLHAVAGAADVQVDLVVAERGADCRLPRPAARARRRRAAGLPDVPRDRTRAGTGGRPSWIAWATIISV